MAVAVNVTELPAVTDWLAGWVVKAGALLTAETVRVATLLVAEPAELVAITVYEPASPAAALAMEKVALVAPAMFTLPFCH